MTHAVVLLARAPSVPGKTRLTSTLADDAAIALRRALLLDTYEAIRATGEAVIVAFTPDDARAEIEALIGESAIPQRGADLGARMHNAVSDAFARGAQRVVLVGSDLPSLPPSHITEALRALDTHDVVLGPSEDGGYYLIGLRRPDERLFAGIDWGTASVLAQTLAAIDRAHLTCAQIAPWFDVDTRDDLARVSAESRAGAALHTREWTSRYTH